MWFCWLVVFLLSSPATIARPANGYENNDDVSASPLNLNDQGPTIYPGNSQSTNSIENIDIGFNSQINSEDDLVAFDSSSISSGGPSILRAPRVYLLTTDVGFAASILNQLPYL